MDYGPELPSFSLSARASQSEGIELLSLTAGSLITESVTDLGSQSSSSSVIAFANGKSKPDVFNPGLGPESILET